jgi:hypothetical protein
MVKHKSKSQQWQQKENGWSIMKKAKVWQTTDYVAHRVSHNEFACLLRASVACHVMSLHVLYELAPRVTAPVWKIS